MTRDEILAMQAAQLALESAPKKVKAAPPRPPEGMDPGFYSAMVSAGAAPVAAPASPPQGLPTLAPPVPTMLPAIPGPSASIPETKAVLPPIAATIAQLPQQAPVMSQVSPAPAVAAKANINNDVTMPTPTFTAADPRPALPTFAPQGLAPNLGNYGAPPAMPGYGMPRTGQPFKPAQSLPTFAQYQQPVMPDFSGLNPAAGPTMGGVGAAEPYYRPGRQFSDNLFSQYR